MWFYWLIPGCLTFAWAEYNAKENNLNMGGQVYAVIFVGSFLLWPISLAFLIYSFFFDAYVDEDEDEDDIEQ